MDFVSNQNAVHNPSAAPEDRFNPANVQGQGQGKKIQFWEDGRHKPMAEAMWEAYNYWNTAQMGLSHFSRPQNNAFLDAINMLFGTQGLFDMRKNNGVHPLAKLVGVGRSLLESAKNNIGAALIGGASGVLLKPFLPQVAGMAKAAGGFFVTIAFIGLTVGFVLFYVIPFLPFVYMFLALSTWVKTIFEAMVGAPLWALAHIRIESGGLPGKAAMAGYFLILEIFLRPIMIIFGFLASISIFSAMVETLNDVWDIVTDNVGGFNHAQLEGAQQDPGLLKTLSTNFKNATDQFFFTIVYTILVYMIGTSSFKLINLIPNQIMRWMGQSVNTFGDQEEDPIQNLVGRTTIGAQQTMGSLKGGVQKLVGSDIDISKLAGG